MRAVKRAALKIVFMPNVQIKGIIKKISTYPSPAPGDVSGHFALEFEEFPRRTAWPRVVFAKSHKRRRRRRDGHVAVVANNAIALVVSNVTIHRKRVCQIIIRAAVAAIVGMRLRVILLYSAYRNSG
jgi:hypothetical protein